MKYTVLADLTVAVRFEVEATSKEEAIEKALSNEVATMSQENFLQIYYDDEDVTDISIECDYAEFSMEQAFEREDED